MPQESARRFKLGRHVGEAKLQGLEFVEPFAEGLALFHVSKRLFQRALRAAERAGGDIEPAAVEPGHRDLEARAFLAEPVGDRHAHILEDDGARRLRVPAHLALVGAERNARRVARHDESGNPGSAVAAGARHHHIEVARAGAGDELLLAVENIMVAVAHRPRRQRGCIRAGARFGQAIARQKLHACRIAAGSFCAARRVPKASISHDVILWIDI